MAETSAAIPPVSTSLRYLRGGRQSNRPLFRNHLTDSGGAQPDRTKGGLDAVVLK
jgi:hypothetical protein